MTFSCPDLPCETFLRVPVKITVHVLAAGCQLSYREFYGIFTVYTCVIETCFGEISIFMYMYESSIERFISLGNNRSNLYENESFSIPLTLKFLFYKLFHSCTKYIHLYYY